MNNGELIKELQRFPEDTEITISDGLSFHFYFLKDRMPAIHLFDGIIDIGIGGFEEEGEGY